MGANSPQNVKQFDPDAFAQGYTNLLHEVQQLRARRERAVELIEAYRERVQHLRTVLGTVSGALEHGALRAYAEQALEQSKGVP